MPQVWKIAPGRQADQWPMCRAKKCIALGWRKLKDYQKYRSKAAILRALGGGIGDGAGAARSIWRFTREVEVNDIVVANRGRTGVVGLGIVQSAYLAPGDPRNPSNSTSLPHARLVEWVVADTIDLPKAFFTPSTLHALSSEKIDAIRLAYSSRYPRIGAQLIRLFDGVHPEDFDDQITINIVAKAEHQLETELAFKPLDEIDARTRSISSIVRRQGQPAFREKLLDAYESKCAVTGCDILPILEAAHISPYMGEHTNYIQNGILLRTDFHTLYDLRMIAICEDSMRLLVSRKLNGTSYERYRGKRVRLPKEVACHPNVVAIEKHRKASGLDKARNRVK